MPAGKSLGEPYIYLTTTLIHPQIMTLLFMNLRHDLLGSCLND